MKRNAQWTVYLQPNWSYDVSVTMGSQADSTYNLNVISASGTYTLAKFFFFLLNILFSYSTFINFFFFFLKNSNLALGVNQYVEKTQRVTTGNDGKITLQEVFFFSYRIYFIDFIIFLIKPST